MKFRLKKWYPSLPKDWEVRMEVEQRGSWFFPALQTIFRFGKVPREEVENNLEFWERVEEESNLKKWLILEHEFIVGSRIPNPILKEADVLECYNIKKVKRIPDEVIFRLGDKVQVRDEDLAKKLKISVETIFEIDRFKAQYITIFNAVYLKNSTEFCIVDINSIKHTKSPILVTEDGVEMFEGDEVYVTSIEANFLSHQKITKCPIYRSPNFKYFAKKENIDKYLDENMPRFSKKDILEFAEEVFFKKLEKERYWSTENVLDEWIKKKGD